VRSILYQEAGEEGEEGTKSEHDSITHTLTQQRLSPKETAVPGTHSIYHTIVLATPWQPWWTNFCCCHDNIFFAGVVLISVKSIKITNSQELHELAMLL
jgi:hypothetical protein